MNAKEIRNLQEAYLEVYAPQEVDEAVKGADPEMRRAASSERRGGEKRLPPSKGKAYAAHAMQQAAYMDKRTKGRHIPGYAFPEEVELDIFDLVLEFLQVEGYAETPEAAEAIMMNMSEEWREDIVEKFVSPYEGKPSYKNPQAHSPATRAMQKSDELQKTEPGSDRQKKQTRRSQQMNRMFQAARRV